MQVRTLGARLAQAVALRPWVLAAAVAILAACGGGDYGGSAPEAPASESRYAATPLVSDRPGAAQLDARLSNPVALAFGGMAFWAASLALDRR